MRVPVDMLVGEENQGWKLITTQLNHERVMLGPAGRLEGLRDRVADWADQGRRRPSRCPTSAGPRHLGEVTAVFRVNELLNWEVARAAAIGEISVGDASSSKVFAADQVQHRSGWRWSASCTATATRRTRRPRTLMHYLDATRRSGTWCSPSAAASTRCSAS